jgi:hypothetical protein
VKRIGGFPDQADDLWAEAYGVEWPWGLKRARLLAMRVAISAVRSFQGWLEKG